MKLQIQSNKNVGYVKSILLFIFGVSIFSKLASELVKNQLSGFDRAIGEWIVSFRTGWLTKLMLLITNLGSTAWLVGFVLVLTLLGLGFRKRFMVLAFDSVAIGALLLSESLKILFHRSRPALPWLTVANGFSFPSGHSLVSLAVYGFLAYLVLRTCKHGVGKYVSSMGLLLLPVLIGISRIYLGVHYPSDVLAGWAVAMGWLGLLAIGKLIISKSGL